MHVTRLELRNFRRFVDVGLRPQPGLNLIIGDNGAGKTSILEGLHLMAYGRSFRGRVRDGLIRAGTAALEVYVEWSEHSQPLPVVGSAAPRSNPSRQRRAGLHHSGQDWSGRLDGSSVAHLGDLCAALAVVSFDPGSHVLISGGGEPRRRYLDWGLFHVEPDFMPLWRRYSRALRQRNALLKSRAGNRQLDAWDAELAAAGEPLSAHRQRYLDALQIHYAPLLADLAPDLGTGSLNYSPGWRREESSLADALLISRDRDLTTGHTSVGPHRADWSLSFSALPGREALSRGQAKLTALAALLAQAEHYAAYRQEWPVVALDDLSSELDRHHQRRVLERLLRSSAQILVTGTDIPPGLSDLDTPMTTFHVKHGEVAAS